MAQLFDFSPEVPLEQGLVTLRAHLTGTAAGSQTASLEIPEVR
jgi:hypothetical protein